MPHVRWKTSGQHEHGHVAAHPVALPGDPHELADHRLLRRRVAVVELQRVRPAWEVGVAPVRQDQIASLPLDPGVVLGLARELRLAGADEILGMILHPGVIRGHVVGDEVEHQPQPARGEALAQSGERRVAAEVAMHRVAADGEARPGDVLLAQVRQRLLELPTPFGIRSRDRAAPPGRSARRSGTRPSRSPSRPGGSARRPGCRPAWPASPGGATAPSARRGC